MKDLDEVRNMLDHIQDTPTEETIDRICSVLGQLIEHVERIDKAASKANNTASCLANGIQPD